jgi:hypothetical protein
MTQEAEMVELQSEARPGQKHKTLSQKLKQKRLAKWLGWESICLVNTRP